MSAKNKPGYQPRYPCNDANPFIPMSVNSLEDVPVYWNQDQIGNDTNGLFGEDGSPLTDEEYIAAITPEPIKFPSRHYQIRAPRCVRFYTISAFHRYGSPVGNFANAKAFVINMKKEMVKRNIMFTVASNYTFCKLLFYPIETIVSIENTEQIGTFMPNNPIINSPVPAYKYQFADFNTDYLDDECYIGSDVLNFYIFDIPYYGNDFYVTDLGINANSYTPNFFYQAPNDTYKQAVEYYKRQNEKTRQRTIVQKWPGHTVTSWYASGDIPIEQMWNIFLSTNEEEELFEIGPDFNYDVDYYVETIDEHWSLQ